MEELDQPSTCRDYSSGEITQLEALAATSPMLVHSLEFFQTEENKIKEIQQVQHLDEVRKTGTKVSPHPPIMSFKDCSSFPQLADKVLKASSGRCEKLQWCGRNKYIRQKRSTFGHRQADESTKCSGFFYYGGPFMEW